MTVAVLLNDLTKSYTRGKQKVNILSAVNLTIDVGEFVAIKGPSGSGKSTLLNLMAGLDYPDAGEVVVGGECISRLSKNQLAKWRSRSVGFVFQFYNLMPTLSAEQNVELPLLLTNLSRAERKRRAQIALSVVGMEERAKHRPAELSGGQLQRVSIARAIVSDPQLLICDEPTGDLDRDAADNVLELLATLNQVQKKTIVMVTHDPKAAGYAPRQIEVDKGVLVEGAR